MIYIESSIPEMKTRRLCLRHCEDVFLKARDLYAEHPAIRNEWISVVDENKKHLYYLNWKKQGTKEED